MRETTVKSHTFNIMNDSSLLINGFPGLARSTDNGQGILLGSTSLERRFIQALKTVCPAYSQRLIATEECVASLDHETLKLMLLGAEIFCLAEGIAGFSFSLQALWEHSLRTASLAGRIVDEHGGGQDLIRQSCAAGILHDIGILALVSLYPEKWPIAEVQAQKKSCPLTTMEQKVLGISHSEIGATLLRRWGVGEPIVEAVAYHDEPSQSSQPGLTPLTAVYVANVIDGGGCPQESDGVPLEGDLKYLAARNMPFPFPKWQRWVIELGREMQACA